jgi:hypothetical protein
MGHTCVNLANPPSSVKAGSNATLQIKYVASFDKPDKETFYACADITYVEFSKFKDKVPCFNATEPSSGKQTDSSALSGGAIAGIVVGVVVGVGLVAAAALLIYRRKQKRLLILRQQNSARGVKWDGQARDSNSSVRMHNMS